MSAGPDDPRAPAGRAAVEALLAEHVSELHAFVRLRSGRLLRSLEAPSDLVQSVCREILQHHERFRFPDRDGFRHWLFTTAARKIANRLEHHRAQKRDVARAVPLEDVGEVGDVLASYSTFCSPSARLRTEDEVRRIEAAFDELPDDYRDVIALHRVAGLPIEVVAERLERSPAAARMLLFRALARFAEVLNRP
jgi:RNA polymerase sigma factor (sigma-70 family)